jgi:RimJ/RimL family protein N-acetyltransferase
VVVLDRLRAEDRQAHLAGEDEEQARRFGWWPKRSGPEEFRAMLAADELSWGQGGPSFRFGTRVSGELVGGCEIHLREPRLATVSYWTFPAYRGRVYAQRAVRLACDWAFDALRLDCIEAHVEDDNLSSGAVAVGAGFEPTGRLDDDGLHVLERRSASAAGTVPLEGHSPTGGQSLRCGP